jgi:uncharacterized protein DUF4394
VRDFGQNIRVRPLDGTVAGTDTNLGYPALGDPNSVRAPRVVAVAYTNPQAAGVQRRRDAPPPNRRLSRHRVFADDRHPT